MLAKLRPLERRLAKSAANLTKKIQKLESEQIAKREKVFHMQHLLRANCRRFCGQKRVILDEYHQLSDEQQKQHIEQLNNHHSEVRNLCSSTTMCLSGADSIGFMKHTGFHQQLIEKSNLILDKSVPQLNENPIDIDVVMSAISQKEKEICSIMQQMLRGTHSTLQTSECDGTATSSTTQSLPLKRKRTIDDAFLENNPGSSTSQDPLASKRGRFDDQNQDPQTATTSTALGSPQIIDSHSSSDSSLTGSTHETQTQAYSEDIQDSNPGSSTSQETPSLDPSIPMLVDQTHGSSSIDSPTTTGPSATAPQPHLESQSSSEQE
ncbi:hypothetical protein LDENG_00247570 [Lucifuga dentata]|nr:hypothetical protein LDENG_00247570 [Lucifuga dentata]